MRGGPAPPGIPGGPWHPGHVGSLCTARAKRFPRIARPPAFRETIREFGRDPRNSCRLSHNSGGFPLGSVPHFVGHFGPEFAVNSRIGLRARDH